MRSEIPSADPAWEPFLSSSNVLLDYQLRSDTRLLNSTDSNLFYEQQNDLNYVTVPKFGGFRIDTWLSNDEQTQL